MRTSADNLLLTIIGGAAVAASLIMVFETGNRPRRAAGQQFQEVLGGLGMGCQIDMSRCCWQFDPRLMDGEDPAGDSLPGLNEISPWHSIALFPMPVDLPETQPAGQPQRGE